MSRSDSNYSKSSADADWPLGPPIAISNSPRGLVTTCASKLPKGHGDSR